MKKIFLTALAICLLAVGGVACAQQTNYNFVRVADAGAQAFVDRMGNSPLYQNLRQQGTLVAFTKPNHRPNFEDPQNFPGMSVWASVFGLSGAEQPNGEVRFYVDPEGYVFVVQVLNMGDPQLATAVMLMAMQAIGLNEQEMNTLLSTNADRTEVWCSATGRKILKLFTEPTHNNVLFFGASN